MFFVGSLVGVTSHTTPLPVGEGLGEGPLSCEFETVRNNALLNLCVLWEKEKSFVKEKTPQRVTCVSSLREGAFFFSQIYTEEQNTQILTETLSQPITQSVTANVSWKASVISVCRRPSVCSKRAPKGSVNSVRSVREKTPQRVSKCSFSHRRTQKNRTHKVSQRH